MIVWNETTQHLVEVLKNNLEVTSITTKRDEISIRCPYCGDSRHNSRDTHLYIKLDVKEGEVYFFHCQKCKTSGIVDKKFFQLLDIPIEEFEFIKDYNKGVRSNNNITRHINIEKLNIKYPRIFNNEITNKKLKYFNNRMGTNLKLSQIKQFKMIPNLYDLLNDNHIHYLTVKEKFAEILDSNYIGFLTADNKIVIMRDITGKKQHYNYIINDKLSDYRRLYIIPNKIDITNEIIDVNVAEGVFDILGVYIHFLKESNDHTLNMAVCGSNYDTIMNYLISKGFLRINLNIYSDADVEVSFYERLLKKYKLFLNSLNLYYNNKEKDFGTKLSNISINRRILLKGG